MNELELSDREDNTPLTTATSPHKQLSQNGAYHIHRKLMLWTYTISFVEIRPSLISKSGAQGLFLSETVKLINPHAVLEREFCHIHPYPDGSLHLFLPMADAKEIVVKGWGEFHPLAFLKEIPSNFIMLYSPRSERELSLVKEIILRSHSFAITSTNGKENTHVNI
jgi:phospholipase/carboxylesterase